MRDWLRQVRWVAVWAVVLVLASLAVLFFTSYDSFGIGLGLAAIVFGLLATRE